MPLLKHRSSNEMLYSNISSRKHKRMEIKYFHRERSEVLIMRHRFVVRDLLFLLSRYGNILHQRGTECQQFKLFCCNKVSLFAASNFHLVIHTNQKKAFYSDQISYYHRKMPKQARKSKIQISQSILCMIRQKAMQSAHQHR